MTDNRLSSNSSLSKPQMRHIVNNLSGQGVDQEVEGWGNEHGGPSDAMNYGLYQYGKMSAASIMNDSLQGLQASAQMSQETLEHYEETGSSELSEGEYMQEADIGKSDGGSDSTKARRTTFIETLYQMVHTPENAPAIGFADDGVSLEVRNTNFFSSNVLPNHFKHRNVSSFIRQLNNYGFRTIPSAKGVFQTFVHDNFRKDRKDLIRFIMRRTSHVVKKKKTLYEQVMELKQRDAERRQHIEQLEAMDLQKCMYIQDLEQRNRILMEERDAALIENQRLIRLVNSQAPGLLKDGPKGGGRNQPSPPPRNTGQYAASSTMASGPRDLQQQQQQQQHHIPPPPPPSFPMASGGTPFHTSFYPPMQLPTSSASSPTSMSGAGGFPALTSQQPFAGQSGGAGRGRSNSGGAGTYWS